MALSDYLRICEECGRRSLTLVCMGPDGPWICPICEYLHGEEQHELEFLHDRED